MYFSTNYSVFLIFQKCIFQILHDAFLILLSIIKFLGFLARPKLPGYRIYLRERVLQRNLHIHRHWSKYSTSTAYFVLSQCSWEAGSVNVTLFCGELGSRLSSGDPEVGPGASAQSALNTIFCIYWLYMKCMQKRCISWTERGWGLQDFALCNSSLGKLAFNCTWAW